MERRMAVMGQSHLELWRQHVMGQFDTAVPDAAIVEHIAYRRDAETLADLRMLRDGWLLSRQIASLTEKVLGAAPRLGAVLDFGCGCARITRFLPPLLAPGGSLLGCDIDAAAIAWNQSHLTHSGSFFVSHDQPPLPLPPEQKFDLIAVISVFTHLPEPMQDLWLAELTQRLTPGGIMIATFHGAYFERFVPAAAQEEFASKGFCYSDLGKTPDLPDYYLTAFHKHDYIHRHWSQFGEIAHIEPQGIGWQDAAVLRQAKTA
jgi:SAM-dependent methyltransferase